MLTANYSFRNLERIALTGIFSLLGCMVLCGNVSAEIKSTLEVNAFRADIAKKVRSRNFDALVADADSYASANSRFPTGRWKLSYFFDGMELAYQESDGKPAEWAKLQEDLLQYAKANPNSGNAWLMYDRALDHEAWRLRGTGYNNTTTAVGRAGYRRVLQDRRQVLEAHKPLMERNPEWFNARIRVALYLGEGQEKIDEIFKNGMEVEPKYYDLYFSAMQSRLPKWGGGADELVRFLNDVAKNPSKEEGISLYALLALSDDATPVLQKDKRISWELMKKSFKDVLDKFPDDRNSQQFFLAACLEGDKVEARKLLKRVLEGASESLHERNVSLFNSCVGYIKNNAPMYIRDPETGAGILYN